MQVYNGLRPPHSKPCRHKPDEKWETLLSAADFTVRIIQMYIFRYSGVGSGGPAPDQSRAALHPVYTARLQQHAAFSLLSKYLSSKPLLLQICSLFTFSSVTGDNQQSGRGWKASLCWQRTVSCRQTWCFLFTHLDYHQIYSHLCS